MLRNKVQEILNQNHFANMSVYSVSGRAINEIMYAFTELQDQIRNEYKNHIDHLKIELDFERMKSENLQDRIDDLQFENDDLQLENSELRDELGIWRAFLKNKK